jgi:hypothetical protein
MVYLENVTVRLSLLRPKPSRESPSPQGHPPSTLLFLPIQLSNSRPNRRRSNLSPPQSSAKDATQKTPSRPDNTQSGQPTVIRRQRSDRSARLTGSAAVDVVRIRPDCFRVNRLASYPQETPASPPEPSTPPHPRNGQDPSHLAALYQHHVADSRFCPRVQTHNQ